jgi:hypothetical protein
MDPIFELVLERQLSTFMAFPLEYFQVGSGCTPVGGHRAHFANVEPLRAFFHTLPLHFGTFLLRFLTARVPQCYDSRGSNIICCTSDIHRYLTPCKVFARVNICVFLLAFMLPLSAQKLS